MSSDENQQALAWQQIIRNRAFYNVNVQRGESWVDAACRTLDELIDQKEQAEKSLEDFMSSQLNTRDDKLTQQMNEIAPMSISERLDEIQARADNATDGPWEADHSEENNSAVKPVGTDWLDGVAFAGLEVDAEFIAHARTDVPALVAALRAVLAINTGDNRSLYGIDFEAGMCKALAIVHQTITVSLGEES